jgi:hypothetical protein
MQSDIISDDCRPIVEPEAQPEQSVVDAEADSSWEARYGTKRPQVRWNDRAIFLVR